MVLPAHWVNLDRAATIDPLDRGLVYGDGLFETMRYEAGRLQLLNEHLRRLQHGCSVIGIDYPQQLVDEQITVVLDHLAAGNYDSAALRLLLTRGVAADSGAGRGYGGEHGTASVMASVFPVATAWRSEQPAMELVNCEYRLAVQPALAGLKHCNRLDQVMAARELKRRGATEGVLYNAAGQLISAVSSNVFLVIGGTLVTPVLDQSGIAGVVRQVLLDEVAGYCNLQAEQRHLGAADVEAASEMFLSNSLQGLRDVAGVDGHRFAGGAVTASLRESFFDLVEARA